MEVVYKVDGKEVTKEQFDGQESRLSAMLESRETLPAQMPACWPMSSSALQVHPRQIPAAMERNRRHGLHVEYTPQGKPILADRGMRRALMRVERTHDNHGGYGD